MNRGSEIVTVPGILCGEVLKKRLAVYPEYDPCIRSADASVRLEALNDIYQVFVPTQMSVEIYTHMELAVRASLKKKSGRAAVQQRYANHCQITGGNYQGIVGGSDSFTIVGTAGIGKSASVGRAIRIIEDTGREMGASTTIPCLPVQCPFDCSSKGMLLQILRAVDEVLGSKYYETAIRARATIDMLIGSVSTVAMNHIGMIVVDEIQNVIGNRNGLNLVGMLTQLINASGISICMVGVPSSLHFFEQEMHLARRSIGLQYEPLPYDEEFTSVCKALLRYRYVKAMENDSQDSQLVPWLYEHSGGVIGIVVTLLHDAQEIAIINGEEELSLSVLNKAFRQRAGIIRGFVQTDGKSVRSTGRKKEAGNVLTCLKKDAAEDLGDVTEDVTRKLSVTILSISTAAKADSPEEVVEHLRKYVPVEEVSI